MSKLTEQAIKTAFLKLLNERPFSRISVQDIARECGINRNSFYYHYHDIPELTEKIIMDRTNLLIETYPDISSLEECVQAAISFILENRKAVSHIYHSVDREVFEHYLMKICEYTVTLWFDKAFAGKDISEKERERLLRFIRFELFGACIDWMNSGMPEEVVGEVKEIVKLSLQLLNDIEKRMAADAGQPRI